MQERAIGAEERRRPLQQRHKASSALRTATTFKMQLRSQVRGLLQGKDEASEAGSSGFGPVTPNKRSGSRQRRTGKYSLLDLPDEVIYQIISKESNAKTLCLLSACSKRLSTLVSTSVDQWRCLFENAFGEVTDIQDRAANLATSWQRLYGARYLAQAEVSPWEKPSNYEIQAAIEALLCCANAKGLVHKSPVLEPDGLTCTDVLSSTLDHTCCIFLVDGSGSVTEDDFTCMTSFMIQVAEYAVEVGATTHLGIIQFSNEVHVESAPLLVDKDASQFTDIVHSMRRMNGGTNIALAVQKAGQLFRNIRSSNFRQVIALLTDGRIDSYQVREARDMVSRLVDEEHVAAVHAFGVGRGVDKQELIRIISGACPEHAVNNYYLPLLVLDDAPW